eukprot:Tbor_TRINITY_DN4763_c0_g1::TRINITY_DN4763_c0_g1_i1::g.16950::m.16950/K21456/GSS; glutathione synthase
MDSLRNLYVNNSIEEDLVSACVESGLSFLSTNAPVTLEPFGSAGNDLKMLRDKQTLWNAVIDVVARHPTFLMNSLAETAASDASFTGRMLQMYVDIYCGTAHSKLTAAGSTNHSIYQPAMLGIFRNDFMEEDEKVSLSIDGQERSCQRWKQVEINTISVAFAGLSPKVMNFHNFVREHYPEILRKPILQTSIPKKDQKSIVEMSSEVVGNALASASFYYVSRHSLGKRNYVPNSTFIPVICFVLQEGERNTSDLDIISSEADKMYRKMFADSNISSSEPSCILRTLKELHSSIKLISTLTTEPPRAVIDDKYEVTLFYFRSCYTPKDFPSESHWETREKIERSLAIKCPSLPHYLCGFKKIQQILCGSVDGKDLRYFLPRRELGCNKSKYDDPFEVLDTSNPIIISPIGDSPAACSEELDMLKQLQENFVPIYSLNPAESNTTESIICEAIDFPDHFVLKPQLEGGGNLVSGVEMTSMLKLKEEDDRERYWKIRKEYILMRRIRTKVHVIPSFKLRNKDGSVEECLPIFRQGQLVRLATGGSKDGHDFMSEFGLYSVILSTDPDYATPVVPRRSEILLNMYAGYIVRSKPANIVDGGVLAGTAFLDGIDYVPKN